MMSARHIRDQLAAWYASASVICWPAVSMKRPTATQALLDRHETAATVASRAPAGLGSSSIVQVLPFQRSANGTSPLALSTVFPIAMQAVRDRHRKPVIPPVPGKALTTQLRPVQRAANDAHRQGVRLTKMEPVTKHVDVDAHET